MAVVQNIIKRLGDDLESKKKQLNAVLDQLSLVDIQIDEVSSVVSNIDIKAAKNLEKINNAVRDVKKAYDTRFDAGCKSNLKWEKIDSWNAINTGNVQESYETWKVVLNGGAGECNDDEGVHGHTNYHGIKYWQRPMDRDYGAELIGEFTGFVNSGDLAVGMTTEQFGNQNPSAPSNFNIGDTITDSLTQPIVFNTGDLPEIVSIGTTSSIGVSTTLIGGITSGSNTFYHFGAGDIGMASIGMVLLEPVSSGSTVGYGQYLSGDGLSKITGFGSDNYTLYYYNSDGVLSTSTIVVPTIILDKPAIGSFAEGRFRVGFVTETVGFYISTISGGFAESKTFYVIKTDGDRIGNFNPVSNPYSPEKLGSITGPGGGIGAGHSVTYTDNGCNSSGEWNPFSASEEIRISRPGDDLIIDAVEEPKVGAGRVNYWVGNDSWPTMSSGTYQGGVPGNPVDFTVGYAPLGATVTIGGSQSTATYGYTSVPPGGGSGCSGLQNSIDNAESELSNKISEYEPPTKELINQSRPLKEEKDKLQLFAWSLLQAGASIKEEIEGLEERLSILRSRDYSEYEN